MGVDVRQRRAGRMGKGIVTVEGRVTWCDKRRSVRGLAPDDGEDAHDVVHIVAVDA